MLLTPLLFRLLSFKASPQRTRLLGAALSIIFVAVMVIHMVMDEFLLHATSFGLGVYLLATYSLKTIQQIADPQIKATLRNMALFGCGKLLLTTDHLKASINVCSEFWVRLLCLVN